MSQSEERLTDAALEQLLGASDDMALYYEARRARAAETRLRDALIELLEADGDFHAASRAGGGVSLRKRMRRIVAIEQAREALGLKAIQEQPIDAG